MDKKQHYDTSVKIMDYYGNKLYISSMRKGWLIELHTIYLAYYSEKYKGDLYLKQICEDRITNLKIPGARNEIM